MDETMTAALDDRAATYGLLARLLGREADVELLAALRAVELPSDTGREALDEGARLMGGYLHTHEADEATRTELAVDFARLFVVRARSEKRAAYPFESVWAGDERRMMGAARDEVRALYRAAGLELGAGWHVGEDHIALELEYMQLLAGRAADAARAADDEAARALLAQGQAFLAGHLAGWVPRFAAVMGEVARTDFYRGLALFTVGFLEEDAAFLSGLA